MKALSEEQLEKVRKKVRQEGINRKDLEHDIVDHISCLIENDMHAETDFEQSFEKVFHAFTPIGGFKMIQFEINYNSIKKIIFMKKTIFVLITAAMAFFFLTTLLQGIRLLNDYQWSFMEDLAFTNQYLICLIVLPVYWLDQYRLTLQSPDGMSSALKRFAFVVGFLCSEALVNAIFFKLLHLPGGNHLFVIASCLGLAYVPLYYIRKFRMAF